MGSENLATLLRERVREFGEKPAYVLSSEELAIGTEHAIFQLEQPEDRGDGTVITKAKFEGNLFVCIKEKD